MNSRDGITQKDNQSLLRRFIQKRAKGNLGLVRQGLRLVKNDDFGGGIIRKKRLKGGTNERIYTAPYRFQATLVAGVQEEGAAKKGG